MSNTIIQIRRSSTTAAPPNGSILSGELAYSYDSGKLFIGNADGSFSIPIGGQSYIDEIDNATSTPAANTLVRRDSAGAISASRFNGPAATADRLTTGRHIALSGDVTGNAIFDGANNIAIATSLGPSGVVPGTYGSGSVVPVVTVDDSGRVTSIVNVAVNASGSMSFFNIEGDTGTPQQVSNNETLIVAGGDGVETEVLSPDTLRINVDSTVLRTTGSQTLSGDLIIHGNVIVEGTRYIANSANLYIGDNIITLNSDLPDDAPPSENAGIEINRGNTNANSGIIWDETNKWWSATSNIISQDALTAGRIHTDQYANATSLVTGTVPSARLSGPYTGITGVGTITSGTWRGTAVEVAHGGTGRNIFTLGGVLYGNTSGALSVTAAPLEGQILQGSSSGMPVFAGIDGGSF